MSVVRIYLLTSKRIIKASTNSSVLNSLIENKIRIAYECRDGFCGTCRVKMIKGKIKYKNNPLGYIEKNQILTCCAFPITDLYLEI